jgi:dienelactone hydrolase
MTPLPRRARTLAISGSVAFAVLVTGFLSGCAGSGHPGAGGTRHPASASPTGSASPGSPRPGSSGGTGSDASLVGVLGSFSVGKRFITFTEPAHTGPTGTALGPRELVTQVFYPRATAASGTAGHNAAPAKGPLPMLVFGPGFMQCAAPYSKLLKSWASAGYVVVAVNFPQADCKVGTAATESDMVNEPADMSYVISRMLRLSAAHHGRFAGLISSSEIGISGQSDGGDVVAAIAANSCCADRRVKAVAVLSGAEWPPMAGRYFGRRPVPMLFTQGSADTINPPGCSVVMYQADPARERYYLNLFGASHLSPYWGINRYERIVARVTVAFFNRFVLDRPAAGPAMRQDGSVPGLSALRSGGRGQFPSRYCNT